MNSRYIFIFSSFIILAPSTSASPTTYYHATFGGIDFGSIRGKIPNKSCVFDVYYQQIERLDSTYWFFRWDSDNKAVAYINNKLSGLLVDMSELDTSKGVGSKGIVKLKNNNINAQFNLKKIKGCTGEIQSDCKFEHYKGNAVVNTGNKTGKFPVWAEYWCR